MGLSEVPKPSFREASFPINFPFVDGAFGSKFIALAKNVILSKFELRGKPLRQPVKKPGRRFVALYFCIEVNTYATDHTLNFVSGPRWTDTLKVPYIYIYIYLYLKCLFFIFGFTYYLLGEGVLY